MIDQRVIQMTKHSDPENRKKAVKALAKSKDRAALPHLAWVYRHDADPEIRDLAYKAGVYVKKNAVQDSSIGDGGYPDSGGGSAAAYGGSAYDSDSLYDDDSGSDAYYSDDAEDDAMYDVLADDIYDLDDDGTDSVTVSAKDEARAESFLDRALTMEVSGDYKKAEKALRNAIKANPNMSEDHRFTNVVQNVTGMSASAWIAQVEAGHKPKTKAKNSDFAATGEATWGEALTDLAIYLLVQVGVTMVVFIITLVAFSSLVSTASAQASAPGVANPLPTQSIQQFFVAASVPLILGVSVGVGIGSLVQLLIQYAAIHFVAMAMMGGDGTFPTLVKRLTMFLLIANLVLTMGSFAAQIILPVLIPDALALSGLISLGIIFGFIAMLWWISERIGQTYDFGAGQGCGTLIVSYILLVVLLCACTFIFIQVSATAMFSIM